MDWIETGSVAPFRAPIAAKTWTMVMLQGASAVALAAMTAAPLNGTGPLWLYAASGFALAAVAGVLLALGNRVGDRTLLAMAALRVVIGAAMVAASTSAGATLFAGAGLVWVAVWVTGFFPRRIVLWTGFAEVICVSAAVVLNGDHLRTAADSVSVLAAAVTLSVVLSQVLNGLRHEARHDEMTGLLNRRGLDQALRDLAGTRRFAGAVSLVVIDLDGLKLVNDHAGHLAGDQMLVTFAGELQTGARGIDLTARVGGDEFIAVLPGLDGREANAWAARLHASSGVAWSYGVAERDPNERLEDWTSRADKLMYDAKYAARAGRRLQASAFA